MPNSYQNTNKVASFLSTADIDQKLEEFWEIKNENTTTQINEFCEEHYNTTHTRDTSGRYIVKLPFKETAGKLGNSKNKAIARLLQIEKRLAKFPEERKEYNNFLAEYLVLGHMKPAEAYSGDQSKVFYLPHHAVYKYESTTTRVRVVFDASCKTDSGLSLNDLLNSGPKIQQDLSQILLRWRKHRYVFTADIEKMFRQIKIAPEDANYQRILWRQKLNEPIQEFVLNTVTYGTAPATYLAIRTLKQLAEDEGKHFPVAKIVLNNDFYVDDMLTGANTQSEAHQLRKQIISLLKRGGFNLRKWTSNKAELLKEIPDDMVEKGALEIGKNDTIKTLGIHWNPAKDEFQFNFKLENDTKLTKRVLLSKIATIFDPLGWLSPVTVITKLIMQSLWKTETRWDDVLPEEIKNSWKKLEGEMPQLQSIRIPRWINYHKNQEVQIHGFCDASEKAYAAVVYTRTIDSFGKVHTALLTAKTKVAPLKQKITLPRLELCGALLLAQLINSTLNALQIQPSKIFAWCDSEITLAWIAKNPNNWHTFVANRVTEIQKLLNNDVWKYIASTENPADIATRGISPSKLATFNIWWRGPLWLAQSPQAWPINKINITTNLEANSSSKVFKTTIVSQDIFTCSTYTKQIRVLAYCLRFIYNSRKKSNQRETGYLKFNELQRAKNCIIKVIQRENFEDEITCLTKNKALRKTSKLLSLHPFIDADGILRVGGRLRNSNLSTQAKHQVLLPQKHHITNIIIDHAHQQTLHGGTQLTLNYVRTQFWIVDGKRVIQGRIHKCIRCARFSHKKTQPLMGDLPSVRISPSPPFSHCGVDYVGPFITKMSKGRGTKTLKGYIALFICMVTKAVHLELVSDLTTEAFLAAYRRFVARRGNCKQIFSDNGTNFVGARNKMEKDMQLAIAQSTKHAAEVFAHDGTEWKFIPAASPHIGGLWEAGVKSVKGHLKRILRETLLTYEEFTTVLYQVEACLNSRPIGQQSSDPNDLEPLTPRHFLIGRPLLAPPEPEIDNGHIQQRWKLVTKLHQDIWKRWSQEYLSLLQQRSKWKTEGKNPSIGELVLVKDDNLPPQKWSLGRIVQLHPGDDGVVRIVSVQYKNEIKKRPLIKICQLPINIWSSDDNENINTQSVTSMMTLKSKKSKICPAKTLGEPELWSKPEHFDKITTTNPRKRNIETNSTKKKEKRPKIAPCTWASKLVSSILLIFYWLTIAFAQDYQIIKPKSGFYIENLGTAHVKRGNLRLQISLSLEEMMHDKANIDTSWIQIKEMCDKTLQLSSITHCSTLFQHLSTKRQMLTRNIDEVIQQIKPESRKKRGVLGSLLTSIFGVNNEVYTDIELLQHNQKDILFSTNQQMLLINAKLNQSNFGVWEKLKQFDARISQVVSTITEMSGWILSTDHNRIGIEVIAAYLSAKDFYDEIQLKYNHWLNAIHKQGHLLNFITLHDINSAIQNTSAKIGSNFVILPTPQRRLDVKTANKTISLHGYLNIVERSIYELLHVTPIPHLIKDNKFAVAELKASTLAVNFNEQSYFSLGEQEFKACSIISEHAYLCTATIVHGIEDSPSCVIDEVYNRHPKTKCEMNQLEVSGTIWKALVMKNTWLYISNETKVVAVVCKEARRELLLNETGIIHIQDDCFIRTREITLKTTIDQQMDVISSYIKEVPPMQITINTSKPPALLQPGLLIRPNEQIMDYGTTPDLQPIFLQRTLKLHSITASSFLVLFIILILVYRYRSNMFSLVQNCRRKEQPNSAETLQQQFDRVLSSGAPQHVHN